MISPPSSWHAYAEQASSPPPGPLPAPSRLEWTARPGVGPGVEAFGRSVRGLSLLELGCGAGRNAAHLAHEQHASVIALDSVDLQIRRAKDHYDHLRGTTYVTCDALRFLRSGDGRFDAVYSVFGAVGLVDPEILLPAIARRLNPSRPLVFSVPHPRRAGRPSGTAHRARTDFLALPDGTRRPVVRWELDIPQWSEVLGRAGFHLREALEFDDPGNAGTPSTLLISARRFLMTGVRPERRGAASRPPSPPASR
ncbi:class I SAM-dependent methyltransferase [Streptomyces sp. NPDC049906]|uniref:class I SAM-dependent methyltransferase n=1 Tax=Streptomyces sp. NPDC049906 TaxID=3155656 RepID=UPI00341A3A28